MGKRVLEHPPPSPLEARPALVGTVFLAAAAFLCLGGVRLGELGFYHDDWKFLADFHFAAPGLWAKMAALVKEEAPILLRPLSIPLFAGLYTLFGEAPLGWHLALLAANVGLAVAVRGVLARFKAPAPAALLGALLFLSYPTKDSTMFWPCVVQAPLAFACWLAAYGLHLDYEELGGNARLAAAAALAVAALAIYDNVVALLPLWLVTPALLERGLSRRAVVSFGVAAGAVAAAVLVKVKLIPWATGVHFNKALVFSLSHAALVYRLGGMCLAGRLVVNATAQFASGAFRVASGTAALAALLPWTLLGFREDEWPSAPRRALALAGAAFIVLGLFPYAASDYVPNPFTHMNRVNEVPALGAVFLLLAGGFALKPRRALAAGCALASLFLAAHVGAAWAWTESYKKALIVRDMIRKNVGEWPADKPLFLYTQDVYAIEKAPIFIANWDITGAAQLWTGDPTRSANVLSADFKALPEGLSSNGNLFPYDSFRVLDVRRGALFKASYADFKH